MAKDCLYCCGCTAVVLLNIVFLFVGIILISLGGLILGGADLLSKVLGQAINLEDLSGVNATDILKEVAKYAGGICAALIVMGIVILALSIIGMCGSCCKSKVLLIVYAVVIGVLLLVQIILIGLYFGQKKIFEESAKTHLRETIRKQYAGDKATDFASLAWGLINLFLQCCGVDNGEDFKEAEKWTIEKKSFNYKGQPHVVTYPLSCCKAKNPPEIDDPTQCVSTPETHSNKNKGCWENLEAKVENYMQYVIYSVAGICGAQAAIILIVILMICCLGKANKVA